MKLWTDDGRTPNHGHPISSPGEPNGSGELKRPMRYTENVLVVKMKIFSRKFLIGFLFLRGGSDEYPQSMFWSKNRYTPANPSFAI